MQVIFEVSVSFKDSVTGEDKGYSFYTREENMEKAPSVGSSVFLTVGDGKDTIFGEGRCEFEFDVYQSGNFGKSMIIKLMPVEFSDVYKAEFVKNWEEFHWDELRNVSLLEKEKSLLLDKWRKFTSEGMKVPMIIK